MNGLNKGISCPLTVASPDLPVGTFPREFTCDGADRLPRRQWSTPPSGTRELVIEMLDPDTPGGTFTAGAAEGVNDFGRRGYCGPCPPRGPRAPLPPRERALHKACLHLLTTIGMNGPYSDGTPQFRHVPAPRVRLPVP